MRLLTITLLVDGTVGWLLCAYLRAAEPNVDLKIQMTMAGFQPEKPQILETEPYSLRLMSSDSPNT